MGKAIKVEVIGFSSSAEIEEEVVGLFVKGKDIPKKQFDDLAKNNLDKCWSFFNEEMVLKNANHYSELEDWELNTIELVEVR